MRITGLRVFPVKSLGGVDLADAVVTPLGLKGDRRWAVLDDEGHTLSSKQRAVLFGLRAEPTADGIRMVDGPDVLEVSTPSQDGPTVWASFSRADRLRLADEEAGRWLSERLGTTVRLVHQGDDLHRSVSEGHGGQPGDRLSLADTAPLHLVSERSLDRLRDLVTEAQGEEWLDRERAGRRFRPNLVVDGEDPFAEDGWRRIRVGGEGGVVLRLSELCDRCVMTTVDDEQQTTKEPVRTLARHRKWDGVTWFGTRLVPELGEGGTATIAVGDEVEVLERA